MTIPQWWVVLWAKMRARYPGTNLSEIAGEEYWADVGHYGPEVVTAAAAMAMKASPSWFPTAPILAEQCASVAQRREEENKRASRLALTAGQRIQMEERERGRWLSGATLYLLGIGDNAALKSVDEYGNGDDLLQLAVARGWKGPDAPADTRRSSSGLGTLIGDLVRRTET